MESNNILLISDNRAKELITEKYDKESTKEPHGMDDASDIAILFPDLRFVYDFLCSRLFSDDVLDNLTFKTHGDLKSVKDSEAYKLFNIINQRCAKEVNKIDNNKVVPLVQYLNTKVDIRPINDTAISCKAALYNYTIKRLELLLKKITINEAI